MEFPLCSSDLFRNSLRFTFDMTFFWHQMERQIWRALCILEIQQIERKMHSLGSWKVSYQWRRQSSHQTLRYVAMPLLTKKSTREKKIISLAPIKFITKCDWLFSFAVEKWYTKLCEMRASFCNLHVSTEYFQVIFHCFVKWIYL